ncbi:uncharacterized protein LOC132199610 [Neocloeon triangulifer]|uniref:uncharacterized protein LOC132199610 n=1 Tax=Neocloeon triangulifer TaxID=2078957 RepID=UPI00286EC3D5|nr:uncharacterized protein LOC132199610 [Neocloeon triangulifer]
MIRQITLIFITGVLFHEALGFDMMGLNFGNPLSGLFKTVGRHRREMRPDKVCTMEAIHKSSDCCNFPPVLSKSELGRCIRNTRISDESKKKAGMGFACILRCTLIKTDTLLENGLADLDKLKQLFLEYANGTWASWSDIVPTVFNKCTSELKNANISTEGECQLSNLHFAFCLYREASAQCPGDCRENKAECEMYRKDIDSCNPWASLEEAEKRKKEGFKNLVNFMGPKNGKSRRSSTSTTTTTTTEASTEESSNIKYVY